MKNASYLPVLLLLTTSAWADKPVVAVFDIEDKGAGLSEQTRNRITDYLTSSLAATGVYQVIPRSTLKDRLKQQKKESFNKCYEESCQIDIGRELAAQKSLSTQVIKVSTVCLVASVMYDLKRSASEGGARAEGGCTEKQILASIRSVIEQLVASNQRQPATPVAAGTGDKKTGPTFSIDFSTTPPGAEVFLDGLSRGKTPLRVSLPSRSYKLRIERKGYSPIEKQIDISGRRSFSFNLQLTTSGHYDIKTRTEWVTLWFHGGAVTGQVTGSGTSFSSKTGGGGGGGVGLFTLKWDRFFWTIFEWFAMGSEDAGLVQWGSRAGYPMYFGARGQHQLQLGVGASVGIGGHDMENFAFVLSPEVRYLYQTRGSFFGGIGFRSALTMGGFEYEYDYTSLDENKVMSYYTAGLMFSAVFGWATAAN